MIKGGLITPQLVRLGKIVIGEQGAVMTSAKGTKFRPPKKLDHFVVKSLYRDDQGLLVEDQSLMGRLGKEPKSLRIRLPFNAISENFVYELRSYKGGMLFCSGDGEAAKRRPVTGKKPDGKAIYGPAQPFSPCGEACPLFQSRECRRFGALRLILEEQQQVGGIYELRTTSRHSIENILSGLMTIQAMTGGILAWVPLVMKLVPQTVQTPEGGSTKVFVIQIVYDGPPQKLLTEVRDILAIRAPLMAEIRQLEAGIRALPAVEEDPQESQETQNEFYPEATEADIGKMGSTPLTHGITVISPGDNNEDEIDDTEARHAIIASCERVLLDAHPQGTPGAPQARGQLIRSAWAGKSWKDVKLLPMLALQAGAEQLMWLIMPPVDPEDDALDEGLDDEEMAERELSDAEAGEDEVSEEGHDLDETSEAPTDEVTDALPHTPATQSPSVGVATTWQIATLKQLANDVGEKAYADVLDTIKHYPDGLPADVYATVSRRLEGQKAQKATMVALPNGELHDPRSTTPPEPPIGEDGKVEHLGEWTPIMVKRADLCGTRPAWVKIQRTYTTMTIEEWNESWLALEKKG